MPPKRKARRDSSEEPDDEPSEEESGGDDDDDDDEEEAPPTKRVRKAGAAKGPTPAPRRRGTVKTEDGGEGQKGAAPSARRRTEAR